MRQYLLPTTRTEGLLLNNTSFLSKMMSLPIKKTKTTEVFDISYRTLFEKIRKWGTILSRYLYRPVTILRQLYTFCILSAVFRIARSLSLFTRHATKGNLVSAKPNHIRI